MGMAEKLNKITAAATAPKKAADEAAWSQEFNFYGPKMQ